MPLIADMIRALHASGAAPEAIAAAVEILERDQEAKDEARRAKGRAGNAERQKRWRERHQIVTPVTPLCNVMQRDEAPTQPNSLGSNKNKIPPSPPTGAQTPTTKTKPGHRLPDDWQPKPRHFEAAAMRGQGAEFVHRCAEAMRKWAGANSNRPVTRKADWDLAFGGWIDREIEKMAARAPPGQASRNGKLSLLVDQMRKQSHDTGLDVFSGSGSSANVQDASAGPFNRSNVLAIGGRAGKWPGDA
jgi:hypothetical protein